MKKHLIIATYDGVGTHYSGVGTITRNIVNALYELLLSNKNLKVSIAYVNVDKKSRVFNSECFKQATDLVEKTGGRMIPLCNLTKGESEWDMWGSFNEWNHACASLVTSLNLILNPDEDNYVILNDTPFLFFAKHKSLVKDEKAKYFYFPLSTGKNHAFGDKNWRKSRIKAEEECFSIVQKDPNSKVISLGTRFADRMKEDYGLHFDRADYLKNGLFFDRYFDYLSKVFENKDLKRFGINLKDHSKIIFSWGRCSVAKGFKELALAWVKIHKFLPNHYLILQMPNNSGEQNYFNEVSKILENTPRHKIIDDFDPEIWKTVLRTTNTDIVCIPSLMDPFPHTSIEAKLFSQNMNYLTIISDIDGAVDAFDKNEAIYVDPTDITQFSEGIVRAANMNNKEKRSIIDKNIKTIANFDFPNILKSFIENNIK